MTTRRPAARLFVISKSSLPDGPDPANSPRPRPVEKTRAIASFPVLENVRCRILRDYRRGVPTSALRVVYGVRKADMDAGIQGIVCGHLDRIESENAMLRERLKARSAAA